MDKLGDVLPAPDQLATALSKQQAEWSERLSRREVATRNVRVLMGCYPDFGKIDPEVFTAAMVELFSRYSPTAQRAAIDPVMGLPSTHKWLPTLSEAKEFLQSEAHAEYEAQRRNELAEAKAAARLAHTPSTTIEPRMPEEERRALVSKIWRPLP